MHLDVTLQHHGTSAQPVNGEPTIDLRLPFLRLDMNDSPAKAVKKLKEKARDRYKLGSFFSI
jgi:hypothetical protein